MSTHFVRLIKETAWGTPTASPVLNIDYVVIDLTEDNALSVEPEVIRKTIRSANSHNRRIINVAEQTKVEGTLSTLFYPSQQAVLMALLQPTGSAPEDVPSFTLDEGFTLESGTVKRRRILGCKFEQMTLSCSQDDPAAKLQFAICGWKPAASDPDATAFPEPAFSDYPSGAGDYPYTFQDTATHLKIGTTRTGYASLEIAVKNILDRPFLESPYVSRIRYKGRDVDWKSTLLYSAFTDRTSYESQSALDCEVTFDNGTNSAKFDFQTRNFLAGAPRKLPLGSAYYQDLSAEAFLDGTNSTDFAITLA